MKIAVINTLVGILAVMKLNKISDKKVKTSLVNNYLYLRKFVKDTDADRQALVDKFQEDWREELEAVEAFRREGKPVVGHEDYLAAEKDANEAIQALYMAEVETSVKAIPMADFMAACGSEELTLEQLAVLQEGGILE